MGVYGRGSRRRRTGLRVALVTAATLAAVALLAGIGAAASPGLVPAALNPAVHSLLDRVGDRVGDRAGDGAGDDDLPIPDLPQCKATSRACVDLDGRHAWLLDGGRVVRGPVGIRGGDDETPTPRGEFTVQWKAQTYMSREYGRPMPWSVFFAQGGVAFHQGTFDAASGGCVKLHEDDARAFFDFLQVGDHVQVI